MQKYLDQLNQIKDNPSELSKLSLELAYQYASESEKYITFIEDITKKKRSLLLEHPTAAKAEQVYELSDEGVWEKKMRIRLKSYEKLMSSIKRRLQDLEAESRNQF